MKRSFSLALWLMLPWVGSLAFAAAPQYSIIDLGVLEPGQGLLWRGLVATQKFGAPGLGGDNWVYATNSVAEVGTSATPHEGVHAARWVTNTSGTTFTDLGLLPNANQYDRYPSSFAYGLNLKGDVVGQSDSQYLGPVSGHAAHGFIWSNGVMTDLGSIAGNGYDSAAYAVNDSREIVGWTATISNVDGGVLRRAFVDIGGTMYNVTFYVVGGPTVLLEEAWGIDCQGNISAIGYPAPATSPHHIHGYLLLRQGQARSDCLK